MTQRVRKLALGLLIALPALPWVWGACVRASWATLGRDQGIFQYIGWAASSGQKAYRDVRDVNGPLTVLVHHVMLALGGGDEHRFRVLDLVLTAGTAALAGACLPWLTRERGRERAASMALAAVAVVLSQYLAYGYWDSAQRESFFDAFVLASMGLQWLAQARLRAREPSRNDWLLLAAAGAASIAPWFGKPTYAAFTVGQLVALLADDVAPSRLRRLAVFAIGGAIGAAVPLLYLVAYGDVGAWARISFVDVPAMYRYIWPRPPSVILELYRDAALWASIPAALVAVLVVTKRMPRAAISLATFPIAGLASAIAQAKGFPYHFHPVTLGATFAILGLLDHAFTEIERLPVRVVAAALALAFGGRAGLVASRAWWPEPHADLHAFDRIDYFPVALREAAALLDRETRPDETVQVYGMDPYLLFLAKRRSATPYIYAYDLNVDAALHGSWDPGGLVPDDEARRTIRAMRDEHERDMVARMAAAPPKAFVFISKSPLMSYPDALDDFRVHCPDAYRWLVLRYHEIADDGVVRVWLRNE